MPTKKRRVGFIPRSDVFDLINKLSYESNLSYSKIINVLVEEALYQRGMLKMDSGNVFGEKVKNNLQKDEYINFKKVMEEPIDNEIYSKFLMFLEFQERMNKRYS